MNIFENHFKEIKNLVLKNKSHLNLNNIDNLKSVSLEIPPSQFNFDLSCNIAMVLGKSNKLNPKDLAKNLKTLFLDNLKNIEGVGVIIKNKRLINLKRLKDIYPKIVELQKKGICYLVGAGPGDLGLVTLKAKRCIETADVLNKDIFIEVGTEEQVEGLNQIEEVEYNLKYIKNFCEKNGNCHVKSVSFDRENP